MSVSKGEMMDLYDRTSSVSVNKISLMFNTFFSFLLLLGFIGLIVFGVYYFSQPNTLPIKKVHVVGDFRHLSPSRLQTLVTEEVKGGFFTVNVTEVRNELLKAPWVEHVSVNRIWPDTLRVSVKERVAVVRWGESALLNANAVHFVPPPATIPKDLPVLSGPDGSYELMLNRFNELKQILKKVEMDLINLTMTERRAWKFTVASGIEVMIGRMDYEKRVKRFAEVVVKAMPGQLDKVKKVDMRYTNGFSIEWIGEDSMPAGVNFDG